MVSTFAGVEVRLLRSSRADELHLTAVAGPGRPIQEQARGVYTALREALAAAGASVLFERIFSNERVLRYVLSERGTLGVTEAAPTRLLVSPGRTGPFAGIQVHAVASEQPPRPIAIDDERPARGLELRIGSDRWLTLSGLSPSPRNPPGRQAQQMFDAAGRFLRQAGTDMRSVARTWLWLRDVCGWYGDLNAARTAFFRREGLIVPAGGPSTAATSRPHRAPARHRLPASTGIGLGCASGAACAMDLLALPGAEDRIEFLEAAGDQDSAFAYGSAFSRAAIAPMPGGRTLLVSGTAAIDAQGRTEHVGQIEAQIDDTLRHVRALLARAGCGDEHVLSALVYCRTPRVEQAFRSGWAGLSWPAVSMIADVCRPDLLFEIELVAGPVPQGQPGTQQPPRAPGGGSG